MTIFEIDEAIENCVLYDPETGEVTGIDEEHLAQLQMARDAKLENVALWYKELTAENKAIAEEIKNLRHRQEVNTRKLDGLVQYLTFALNGEKLRTPKVAVSYRTSHPVEITDEGAIPDAYTIIKREISKTLIKDAIKDGIEVPGAIIADKISLTIK